MDLITFIDFIFNLCSLVLYELVGASNNYIFKPRVFLHSYSFLNAIHSSLNAPCKCSSHLMINNFVFRLGSAKADISTRVTKAVLSAPSQQQEIRRSCQSY